MAYVKYLTLQSGREIKLRIEEIFDPKKPDATVQLDVLIKDPKDERFHPPIEISHPKYWKLKGMDDEQSRELQIKYSGIKSKQLRKALSEFKSTLMEYTSFA